VNKALSLTIFLLSFLAGSAQDLTALWSDFRSGTSAERVKACDELSRYYRAEAHDSLKVLGEDLFLYGIDQHYYPAIEQGKLTLADYFILTGKTSDGITMAKALLSNMEERGDDRMLCAACRTISFGYIIQKDSKSAYHWAFRASRYGNGNPDPIVRAEALGNLAESFFLKNNPEKAIETYRKYITLIRPHKKYRSMSAAYARMGDMYRQEGDIPMASRFFRYSMKYAKLSKRTTPLAHALNNLAIIYFEQGDTAHARKYFERALALRQKTQDTKAISESYYNLGDYHFYISQTEKATRWYQRSLDIAKRNDLKNEQADALRAMAAVAKAGGDYKGATDYLEQFVELQQQIIVQNSSDDEEVAGLQQTIIRLEAENAVHHKGFQAEQGFFASIKWEWIVIVLLVVLLGYAFVVRRAETQGS
jgi:tetratricopeptide (TPR) repeat protein